MPGSAYRCETEIHCLRRCRRWGGGWYWPEGSGLSSVATGLFPAFRPRNMVTWVLSTGWRLPHSGQYRTTIFRRRPPSPRWQRQLCPSCHGSSARIQVAEVSLRHAFACLSSAQEQPVQKVRGAGVPRPAAQRPGRAGVWGPPRSPVWVIYRHAYRES